MQTTESILHAMQALGMKREPITRIYRQLWNENLYLSAYSRLYANEGALTPGATSETVDGMSLQKIHRIVEHLKTETYRWQPVRRHYIKRADGRPRPLGLPTWSDKLVEEVIRMLLEAYYEPIFSSHSHGYRPQRGCHTALQEVVSHWTGTTWFIEGDITGCFDNINHDRLMAVLGKRIHDPRLLRLIRYRLESGIMEDWQYRKTYSGTPQGGVLSPLLANIYLHELDEFVETELLPQWNHGKTRKMNPKYQAIIFQRRQAKSRGDLQRFKALTQEMRQHPSQDMHDPDFRRLKYVRYADDFLMGFIGTKAEATALLQQVETFLNTTLHLKASPTKSKVTHAKSEATKFLGYGLRVYTNVPDRIVQERRSANGRVTLQLPEGYVEKACREWKKGDRPRIVGLAMSYSVEEALTFYQTRYRGIVNYYQYAVDVHELARLKYAMEQSLVHTLAAKLKVSVNQIYRRYATFTVKEGTRYKVLQSTVADETTHKRHTFTWGGIPLKRRRMVNQPINDTIQHRYQGRNELVSRLLSHQCELCGKVTDELEGHHVHRIKDLPNAFKGKEIPAWASIMIARRRKSLFVCVPCHQRIHSP
ncbi:MAG: reverse transcriptase/maturase family protein [Phototrophicaceae bacterium]